MSRTYSLDAAAAHLRVGRNTLTKRLRELGLLDAQNRPAGRERGGPHFRLRCRTFQHPVTGWTHYSRTEITEQGLAYIARLLAQPAAAPAHPEEQRPTRKKKGSNTMPNTHAARPILPLGTLHDAGELIVITMDGERTHHRAALVVVFETAAELQQAINAHRCAYQIRRDIPEEQLHPELTARRA